MRDTLAGRGAVFDIEGTLQQATYAIQNQQPNEAARLAQIVLERSPANPRALHLYGHALLMLGQAKEAVMPLETAFRSLRDPLTEAQLGIALHKSGRTAEALDRFARAIKRKPPLPAAVYEYGYLLFSIGRMDEAVNVLKIGIEAAPQLPALAALLGWAYHASNDSINAKAAFARALNIAPNNINALHGMGLMLMGKGEFAQAAEYFRRILLNHPSDEEAQLYLGACLLEIDPSQAALTYLRSVARSSPNYYGRALSILSSSGRGRFWLRPSAAGEFFKAMRS